MKKVIFNDFTPIFIQIIEYIKIELITGQKKPGEKLLSVRDLAKNFEINPNTVQKAYQLLEEEEIIKSERGSGNYITEDIQKIMAVREEMVEGTTLQFIDKMKSYGYSSDDIQQIVKKKLEAQI
jgi:DNA-binding transcriptional regulator YhcF (GntR family)